ncbi:hypothetical protein VTN02DRAFT_5652 [Thermoascus thermophilus]
MRSLGLWLRWQTPSWTSLGFSGGLQEARTDGFSSFLRAAIATPRPSPRAPSLLLLPTASFHPVRWHRWPRASSDAGRHAGVRLYRTIWRPDEAVLEPVAARPPVVRSGCEALLKGRPLPSVDRLSLPCDSLSSWTSPPRTWQKTSTRSPSCRRRTSRRRTPPSSRGSWRTIRTPG